MSATTDLGAERTMQAIVTRLSRPSVSGEAVIERAAIMAEGADSHAIIGWILSHGGRPEATAPPAPARGLHGGRLSGDAGRSAPPPRYVLPAGALP